MVSLNRNARWKAGKLLFWLLFTLGSFSAGAQQGALFDDHWKFALGDHPAAAKNTFDDKNWKTIDLPHDWSIQGAPSRQNPSGAEGGYFATGIGWYRKQFTAPASWKGKEVTLLFEGVYRNAEVFLNGRSMGVHPYGFTPFYFDLTPWLHQGKENTIAVCVDNSQQPNCRWYTGSGIYRHVRILVKDPTHIDPFSVAITTPDVGRDKAVVNIQALLNDHSATSGDLVLSTMIIDPNGKPVARDSVSLEAKQENHLTRTIAIASPLLWSVDSPHLYKAMMTLTRKGKRLDQYTSTFGIRTIAFSAENGFQLNGKSIKLNGGCIHHDNGCIGAVACDRAEERKIALLKAAGFNAVRTSHNPPSTALLDACDRQGLLVIDEAFDGWREAKKPYDYTQYFDSWWQRDLSSMVLRDRNHPSIIIWSIGNEILERKSPDAVKTARALVSLVHQYDTTRPVTSAMTTWDKEWAMFDPLFAAQDIGGYNYQLFRAPSDHQRVPSRVIVQSESYPKEVFTNWDLIRQNNYIIGDFVWTAMDYLGESGIGRNIYPGEPDKEFYETDLYPWHGSDCGDIDVTGYRKAISHYRNILNNNTEKLYMAVREPKPDTGVIKESLWSVYPSRESWSWPGREGRDMQVVIYSKHPKLRLYLNDSLVGERSCTAADEYKVSFTVPYSAGTLKAIGSGPDNTTDSAVLRTAAGPRTIQLIADRKTLWADGQDLSYIQIAITDPHGIVDPNAGQRLHVTVDGPALLAGIANSDMKDLDSYAGNSRKARQGRALVVLRSTHQPGKITLRVSATGLSTATIILDARPSTAALSADTTR